MGTQEERKKLFRCDFIVQHVLQLKLYIHMSSVHVPTCVYVFWLKLLGLKIGDETGQLTAQMNLADLKQVLGINGNQ